MADVSTNIDAEITADSAWLGVGGLRSTEHLSTSLDRVVTFPDHGTDRPRAHVLNEASEESLLRKISIVLFHVLLAGTAELHGDKFETLLLEALDDLSNEATLDAIGLDHDESALLVAQTFNVHISVSLLLDVLDRFSIVLPLAFNVKEVSKLLDAMLRVIIVLDDGAVGLISGVGFKTLVKSAGHVGIEVIIGELLTILFPRGFHVARHLPHLLEGDSVGSDGTLNPLSVLGQEDGDVNLDIGEFDFWDLLSDVVTDPSLVADEGNHNVFAFCSRLLRLIAQHLVVNL